MLRAIAFGLLALSEAHAKAEGAGTGNGRADERGEGGVSRAGQLVFRSALVFIDRLLRRFGFALQGGERLIEGGGQCIDIALAARAPSCRAAGAGGFERLVERGERAVGVEGSVDGACFLDSGVKCGTIGELLERGNRALDCLGHSIDLALTVGGERAVNGGNRLVYRLCARGSVGGEVSGHGVERGVNLSVVGGNLVGLVPEHRVAVDAHCP